MVRPKAASHMKNKVINGYYLKMLEEWDFVTEVLKGMLRNEGNGGNRNYASTNSHQSNPFQSNQFQSNQLPIQRIHHKNNISDWSVKITNLLRYIDNYGMSKVILKNDVNYLNHGCDIVCNSGILPKHASCMHALLANMAKYAMQFTNFSSLPCIFDKKS